MNAITHSLSGDGQVVAELVRGEVARRVEEFTADMKPESAAGEALVRRMAMLSVRMERAAEHESASMAHRVRHAAEAFDEERLDQAESLFTGLAANPRAALRKLKGMPEGLERLIDAWSDLLADLAVEPGAAWTDDQLEQAANLTGMQSRHAKGSPMAALNRAIRGDFAGLAVEDGAGLGVDARKRWAKAQLCSLIEAEVTALSKHDQTLDHETLAIDRAEAGDRAVFDASKPACLARRYEAEASRGFFKSLAEFRKVEAEAKANAESSPSRPPAPRPVAPAQEMASFRQTAAPDPRESAPNRFGPPTDDRSLVQTADGRPLSVGLAPKMSG